MTGLRAIGETIPSTLHTLSWLSPGARIFERRYRRSSARRNKVRTKYDVCSHSKRIASRRYRKGQGTTTFFFFSRRHPPTRYRSFVSEMRGPKMRLSGRESVSAVQFDVLDAPFRVMSKPANSQTRTLIHTPSPCNSTKERISKRN